MRRILLVALVAMAVAGGAFGWRTAALPQHAMQRALFDALRDVGLTATAGPSRLTLWPTPRARIEDVRLSDASGAEIARIPAIVVTPRLIALLTGAVRLEGVTLEAPRFAAERIDLDAVAERLAARGEEVRPPSVRVVDGVVTWPGGTIEAVDVGFVWPSRGPLAVSGAGRFHGRTVEGGLSVSDAREVLRGGRGTVKVRIAGFGARVAFDGVALTAGGERRLEGEIAFRAAALKDLSPWLRAVAPGARLEGATLTGRAVVDRSGLDVEGAEIAIDGATFTGAARLGAAAGRPKVEATLDAPRIDLTRYLDAFGPAVSPDGGWSMAALDVRPFDALDLDLRISTRSVTVGAVRLGETAATVNVADGALDVAVGEAAAYGGLLRGRAVIAPDGETARVRLEARVTDVDVDDALKATQGAATLSGAASADAVLEGRGRTVAEIVESLHGRGAARLEGGVIGGFQAKALALLGLGGRLEIRSAAGAMTVTDGVARTDDLVLGGPAATLRLSGEADARNGGLSLGGALNLSGGEGAGIPVRVEGSITEPRFRLGARGSDRRPAWPTPPVVGAPETADVQRR